MQRRKKREKKEDNGGDAQKEEISKVKKGLDREIRRVRERGGRGEIYRSKYHPFSGLPGNRTKRWLLCISRLQFRFYGYGQRISQERIAELAQTNWLRAH